MWKTAFKNFEVIWSAWPYSHFLEAVFHKFYLAHSWILCHICLYDTLLDFYIAFNLQLANKLCRAPQVPSAWNFAQGNVPMFSLPLIYFPRQFHLYSLLVNTATNEAKARALLGIVNSVREFLGSSFSLNSQYWSHETWCNWIK